MNKLWNKKAKGFTLVELIVVIAIVGVLAAVLTISVTAYIKDSRRSQALSDARNISLSVFVTLSSPSRSGSPLRQQLASMNGTDTYIISYDGTGAGGKNPIVVELLTEMNNPEYESGFVVFISNAGSDNPTIDAVYVYALKPELANSQSRDVEPDGAAPTDAYTSE